MLYLIKSKSNGVDYYTRYDTNTNLRTVWSVHLDRALTSSNLRKPDTNNFLNRVHKENKFTIIANSKDNPELFL